MPQGPAGSGSDPERSPAFQKMLRNQMRVGMKRMYTGIGDRLALSNDEANKLLDLLADQQSRLFNRVGITNEDGNALRSIQETRAKNQAEIADLIGADKAQELQKFQDAMPARMELDMIAGQLEGAHAALSAEQNKRMLDMMVEERARVPQPQFDQTINPEDTQKSYISWEADYNDRVATQARSILNSEQLAAYDDYQQLQKEIRQQAQVFLVSEPQRTGGAPVISFGAVTTSLAAGEATPAIPLDKKPN
jgi:nicotinic acid mononucleotide adenylyltransferase